MSEEKGRCCPRRAGWLLLAAGVAGAALWANRRYLTVHSIRTGGSPEFPDIVPQVFAHTPNEVRAAVLQACRSLPGWEIAESEGDEIRATAGECTCRRRTLTIRMEPLFDGRMTKVSVSSDSEGRLPDLGANARGIRAFQACMRELLPSGGSPHAG